jgi:hypothetical protein
MDDFDKEVRARMVWNISAQRHQLRYSLAGQRWLRQPGRG